MLDGVSESVQQAKKDQANHCRNGEFLHIFRSHLARQIAVTLTVESDGVSVHDSPPLAIDRLFSSVKFPIENDIFPIANKPGLQLVAFPNAAKKLVSLGGYTGDVVKYQLQITKAA